MMGLAFFLIGVAIVIAFVVLGWKISYKAQDEAEKREKIACGYF